MPRTCTICVHNERKRIDAALAAGEAMRGISRHFRVSEDALARHKAHVAGAIVKAAGKREESIGESVLSRLEKLYERSQRILDDAEASGDGRLALAAIREVRETLGGLFALAMKSNEGEGVTFLVPNLVRTEPGERLQVLRPGERPCSTCNGTGKVKWSGAPEPPTHHRSDPAFT